MGSRPGRRGTVLLLLDSPGDCWGAGRGVPTASQHSAPTLPGRCSHRRASARPPPSSQSPSDLSLEFYPLHSLSSFPFLWALEVETSIMETSVIQDSGSSPSTLLRRRSSLEKPFQGRPCAGTLLHLCSTVVPGVSPRPSDPTRWSSQAQLD